MARAIFPQESIVSARLVSPLIRRTALARISVRHHKRNKDAKFPISW
jgi:hypothetical protein